MLSPHSKAVVLCKMPGMSFGMYNRDDGRDYYELQSVFNEGIRLVNARIRVINKNNGMMTPGLEGHVHKIRHGKKSNRYAQTTTDGLHYNSLTKEKLSRHIVKTIRTNLLRLDECQYYE